MKRYNTLLLLSLTALVTSCNFAPRYHRPKYLVPCTWRTPIDYPCPECPDTLWWEQFNDPVLNQLIETALLNNQSIKVAAANVMEFFYQYGIARSALYPQIDLGAQFERQRSSAAFSKPPLIENIYETAFTLTWDLDLWGKIRNLTEAAYLEFLEQVENRRNVVLTLVTNLANAYVVLLSLDKQLVIGKRTLEAREYELKISKISFDQGFVSEMEVKQAESEVYSALAAIEILEILIPQQENLISVLLGQNPGPIPRGGTIDDLNLPKQLPAMIPAEVLNQRPDIIAAEQAILAAGANIGAARALFFPDITLTGTYGAESMELRDLLNFPNRIWNYTVAAAQIIFDGGRIYSNLKEQEAVWCAALHSYILTIQTAFEQVDNALIDHVMTLKVLETRRKRVAVLKDYFHFASIRFQNGESDYLTVLDAERNLFETELDEVSSQQERLLL